MQFYLKNVEDLGGYRAKEIFCFLLITTYAAFIQPVQLLSKFLTSNYSPG